MPTLGFALVLLVVGRTVVADAAASRPDDLRSLAAIDLDGRTVQPFALTTAARGVVLVFTRSDCPVANRYAPDLERLQQRAAAAKVDFWLVFVDPAEGAAAIRDHLSEYAFTGRALRDPQHALVRATGVTIAPEAAVFDASDDGLRLVYRGRIDDRYLAPGRMRPAPTTRDLERVIEVLRDAGPLARRETQAVGCVIADLR